MSCLFFFLMIRRPPRSTLDRSSAASDVYKRQLISIARNFNATGFRNLYDFLNYLKDSIANQVDEAQAGISSNIDAVQMMTIHQSKGLEFPIVFLIKTDESGISSSIKSGEVKIDKKFGLLTKIPLNQNYFAEYQAAPITYLHNYYEEKKSNAELKRLLYVALTRAKDELYISTTIKKDSSFKKDSFIDLLSTGLKNDLSSDEVLITDNLEYLKLDDNHYKNIRNSVELKIPIICEIENVIYTQSTNLEKEYDIEIYLSSISTPEKGEIISASKVSIYNQCPLKYILTYDYGFSKLNSEYKTYYLQPRQSYSNDFTEHEEDHSDDRFITFGSKMQNNDSAMYGKIFHKVMEESISIEKLDDFITNKLDIYSESSSMSKNNIDRLKTGLGNYYKSKTWQMISQSQNFKNEFEIYVKEKDYFLHGIIDKIIFEENKILIYDYKTDDIQKKEIKKHSEYYLMQLKFYLYIASRLFTQFDTYEGSLVFVKHPDDIVTLNFNKNDIQNLENEISVIIEFIRNKNSEKKISHCNVCSFSDSSNKCIIN